MTNLSIQINRAVDEQDSELAGRIAEVLRFGYGWTYDRIIARVEEEGIEGPAWDALLGEPEIIEAAKTEAAKTEAAKK